MPWHQGRFAWHQGRALAPRPAVFYSPIFSHLLIVSKLLFVSNRKAAKARGRAKLDFRNEFRASVYARALHAHDNPVPAGVGRAAPGRPPRGSGALIGPDGPAVRLTHIGSARFAAACPTACQSGDRRQANQVRGPAAGTLPRICVAERGPHHCSSDHRCTGSGHGVQLRQVPRQLRHVLHHWS